MVKAPETDPGFVTAVQTWVSLSTSLSLPPFICSIPVPVLRRKHKRYAQKVHEQGTRPTGRPREMAAETHEMGQVGETPACGEAHESVSPALAS